MAEMFPDTLPLVTTVEGVVLLPSQLNAILAVLQALADAQASSAVSFASIAVSQQRRADAEERIASAAELSNSLTFQSLRAAGVEGVSRPTILTSQLAGALEGTAYSQDIDVETETDINSFTATGMPTGMSAIIIDSRAATAKLRLVGTLAPGTQGNYSIALRVQNDFGPTTKALPLTVGPKECV